MHPQQSSPLLLVDECLLILLRGALGLRRFPFGRELLLARGKEHTHQGGQANRVTEPEARSCKPRTAEEKQLVGLEQPRIKVGHWSWSHTRDSAEGHPNAIEFAEDSHWVQHHKERVPQPHQGKRDFENRVISALHGADLYHFQCDPNTTGCRGNLLQLAKDIVYIAGGLSHAPCKEHHGDEGCIALPQLGSLVQ